MTQLTELSGDIVERVSVPAQATAGTAEAYSIITAERALTVTAVRWIPHAAVIGAAINNFALQAVNKGTAGAGSGAVSTVTTFASGTNASANVPVALAIGAAPSLAVGEVLALSRTVNGTGLASPGGVCEVTYRYS